MTKRSTINVMSRLLKLVRPLAGVMSIAIIMGCLGFFCASFISVLGGYAILDIMKQDTNSLGTLFIIIGAIAVLRGILHYIEQYCNHFIAFKLLALIRDKVFTALRKLAPAKLDSADRGNLVSIITSDIELLEVFYAHTVSPVCIALITSCIIIVFISSFNILLGLIALISHLALGVFLPIFMSKKSKLSGDLHRKRVGDLNTFFLDSLRGTKEILQFGFAEKRKEKIRELSETMEKSNEKIKKQIGKTSALTNLIILFFCTAMLFTSATLFSLNLIETHAVIIPTMVLFSSFGAVTATANLGAGLTQTIASGNRVLDILDDTPIVEEVENSANITFEKCELKNVSFTYDSKKILEDFSLDIKKNQILGIMGKSGSGKSTILKLIMRFWDVQQGEVLISGENLKKINTKSLRDNMSFVTQETHMFNDSIENNLKIANLDATSEQVVAAAKKASVHEFIETLPQGYQTQIGELGDTLSGGEKQRLGIARAFLHTAPLILLDEPTSNLDSLNEAVILNSLKGNTDKTIVMVSHRKSSMNIADCIFNLESDRLS